MMKRRGIVRRPTVPVPAVLTVPEKVDGKVRGRWMLLTCEQGHLKASIPYGDWSDARKKYGRRNATIECAGCFDG